MIESADRRIGGSAKSRKGHFFVSYLRRVAGSPGLLILLLLVMPACKWKVSPTYPASQIATSLNKLCQRDYKLSIETRHAGKSLQAHHWKIGLFKGGVNDLQGMSREALTALEHMLLCSTRIALSTDAKLDFIEIRIADVFSGASITLWRYVPDIKDSMLQRFGDTEYMNRLLIDIQPADSSVKLHKNKVSMAEGTKWNKPLSMSEFIAKQIIMRARREGAESILAHADLTEPETLGVVIDNWAVISEEGPEQAAKIQDVVRKNAQKVVKGYRFNGFREIVLRDGRGAALYRGPF